MKLRPSEPHTIFWVAGDKGGIGKSTFARALAQHLLDQGTPFTLIETDRVNPDVHRCYKGLRQTESFRTDLCIISESTKYEESAKPILESALKSHVVVNLPAQIFPSLRNWLEKNNVANIAKQSNIQMHCAHLSNGGYDSNQIFKRYLKLLPFDHFYFVKNLGINSDWSGIEADQELTKLFTHPHVTVFDFPELHGAATRNKIDKLAVPYGQALEDEDHFDIFDRSRIESFLEQVKEKFQQARIFSDGTEDNAK